jgi:hypothetical protein
VRYLKAYTKDDLPAPGEVVWEYRFDDAPFEIIGQHVVGRGDTD